MITNHTNDPNRTLSSIASISDQASKDTVITSECRFAPKDTVTFKIQPKFTLAGTSHIRMPYAPIGAAGITSGYKHQIELASWDLKINSTGINFASKIGGQIDNGGGLVADREYLVWGLFDFYDSNNEPFKGFGFTLKPHITGATAAAIAMGGSGIITFPVAGDGWRFNVGARVIIRPSTALNSKYNQGIITAQTSTTITVTADASYAAPNESNAGISGLVEVLQIDKFAPRLYNEDSLYPGSGAQYAFSYMGSFQTNTAKTLKAFRLRGEPVVLHAPLQVYAKAGLAVQTTATVCLCRWLPRSTKLAYLYLTSQRTLGAGVGGYISAGIDVQNSKQAITGNITSDTIIYGNGLVWVSPSLTSIFIDTLPPAASELDSAVYVTAYVDEEY